MTNEKMLITFSTPAYPRITMFGDIAVKLLNLMGHSGKIPGALSAADVPAALAKLRAGVQAQASSEPEPLETDDPAAEPRVGVATRAFPLIELLEAAAASEKEVMWDK